MDDNQNNGGILSKFRERLRKIKLSRSKKKINNEKFIQEKVAEIRRERHVDSILVHKKVKVGKNTELLEKDNNVTDVIVEIRKTAPDRMVLHKKVGKSNSDIRVDEKEHVIDNSKEVVVDNKEQKVVKSPIINNDVVKVRKHQRLGHGIDKKLEAANNIGAERKELLNKLGTEIIEKIKDGFEDKLDELQVLESELYFLREQQNNELELKKVKEIKDKINELVKRINEIIDQYNLYKGNYYVDYVIGLDDNILVDDIIKYRDLLNSMELEKQFVKEYKALDEFKSLYVNLKVVRDDTERLVEDNEKKIEEFDIRDKKYDDIKLKMVPIDDINRECSLEIARQNEYFNKLMEKVNVINKEEYTTMHLRGLGELMRRSLNYMGLLMLSPLSGLIPSIGIQTLATRRMIGNIYQNLHFEEVRHVEYNAINYDSELHHHLCNIDYTSNLMDDTLNDIERLKEDFLKQYDSRIPGYENTLKNLNDIEKKLYQNQHRLEIVRGKLKNSKKINEDKMVRVRELNNNQRNV